MALQILMKKALGVYLTVTCPALSYGLFSTHLEVLSGGDWIICLACPPLSLYLMRDGLHTVIRCLHAELQ